jgi:hypothetical protein
MTLELHSSAAEDLDPLLMVSFPGSLVNENLKLAHQTVPGSSWKSQMSAETRELSFTGSNFGKNTHTQDTCQWLVGVVDMNSDIISLHPISHTFVLRSSLKVGFKLLTVGVFFIFFVIFFLFPFFYRVQSARSITISTKRVQEKGGPSFLRISARAKRKERSQQALQTWYLHLPQVSFVS